MPIETHLFIKGNDAESNIFEEELNEYSPSYAKAIDYTLYFSSHHFDLFDQDNWDNYKVTNTESDTLNHRLLLHSDDDEISACSSALKELSDRKLCVHFDHAQGLKLAVSDNAMQSPNDMMMYEFNNDDHWNRIDIVDHLNTAAARGIFV